jgi:hypothetical protein
MRNAECVNAEILRTSLGSKIAKIAYFLSANPKKAKRFVVEQALQYAESHGKALQHSGTDRK